MLCGWRFITKSGEIRQNQSSWWAGQLLGFVLKPNSFMGWIVLRHQLSLHQGHACSKHAEVSVPSLENWEKNREKFTTESATNVAAMDFRSPLVAGERSNQHGNSSGNFCLKHQ
jgi:hypothetical protein